MDYNKNYQTWFNQVLKKPSSSATLTSKCTHKFGIPREMPHALLEDSVQTRGITLLSILLKMDVW